MAPQEILDLERNNHDKIILFLNGLFWNAYELSAFRWVTRVKPFKARRKMMKPLGIEVASIGVPTSHLYNIIKERQLEIDERTDNLMFIRAPKPIDDHGFDDWKSELDFLDPVSLYFQRLHSKVS
jgi:hypothetical protein